MEKLGGKQKQRYGVLKRWGLLRRATGFGLEELFAFAQVKSG